MAVSQSLAQLVRSSSSDVGKKGLSQVRCHCLTRKAKDHRRTDMTQDTPSTRPERLQRQDQDVYMSDDRSMSLPVLSSGCRQSPRRSSPYQRRKWFRAYITPRLQASRHGAAYAVRPWHQANHLCEASPRQPVLIVSSCGQHCSDLHQAAFFISYTGYPQGFFQMVEDFFAYE